MRALVLLGLLLSLSAPAYTKAPLPKRTRKEALKELPKVKKLLRRMERNSNEVDKMNRALAEATRSPFPSPGSPSPAPEREPASQAPLEMPITPNGRRESVSEACGGMASFSDLGHCLKATLREFVYSPQVEEPIADPK